MTPDCRQGNQQDQRTTTSYDKEEDGRHQDQQKTEKFEQKTMDVGKEERSRRHRRRLHRRSQPTRMLAPVLALPISMQKIRSQLTRMITPALDWFPVAPSLVMQKKGFLPGS